MKRFADSAIRQRGWAGIAVLLLALVVVGFVFRYLAKQMEQSDSPPVAAVSASPAAGSADAVARTSGTAKSPLEKARGLEADVLRAGAAAETRATSVDKPQDVRTTH